MMICSHCGTQGEPRTYTRGCVIVEAVFWLAFIVPGILYSAWRRSTRYPGCPACEAPHMVPADSPQGAALLQRWEARPTAPRGLPADSCLRR